MKNEAYLKEKLNDLINAPSCCAEAKAAAEQCLAAIGTDKEKEAVKALIDEIKEDIMPIDMLIAFTASEDGKKIFGEERAKQMNAHAIDVKNKGGKYCDCPACTAVAAILEKSYE